MNLIIYQSGGTFPQPPKLAITPAVRAKVRAAGKLLDAPGWPAKIRKMFPGHTMDELTALFCECAHRDQKRQGI